MNNIKTGDIILEKEGSVDNNGIELPRKFGRIIDTYIHNGYLFAKVEFIEKEDHIISYQPNDLILIYRNENDAHKFFKTLKENNLIDDYHYYKMENNNKIETEKPFIVLGIIELSKPRPGRGKPKRRNNGVKMKNNTGNRDCQGHE